ncbi:MAG: cupin domain-containing protein [Xanthobacteraceae bacterium]|nr:cupin domain-containing protein [Xanthobacteraceae bacterium]QYK44807.1 MAG: cupin domain-containing protein [Xanthobacteraceae bacterium]
MSITALSAAEVIALLDLRPHPEGGHFRETFRDMRRTDGRAASTAIYFLLAKGERSHWHKVDAAECWHYYAGAPLALHYAASEHTPAAAITLGTDITNGQQPQFVIPQDNWQAAETLGEWTLVGCTVAPGFEFSGFMLARKDWSPGPLSE